jgi:hypothetical protein
MRRQKLAPAVTKGKNPSLRVDYKDIARDLQKGSVVQLDGGLLPTRGDQKWERDMWKQRQRILE